MLLIARNIPCTFIARSQAASRYAIRRPRSSRSPTALRAARSPAFRRGQMHLLRTLPEIWLTSAVFEAIRFNMLKTRVFLLLSAATFCASLLLAPVDVLATSHCPGTVSAGTCGQSGHFTMTWVGNWNCSHSPQDDYEDLLCASTWCMQNPDCPGTTAHMDPGAGCLTNQYGSWMGFKCYSSDPDPE